MMFAAVFSGCGTTKAAVKANYDFSAIKKVAVLRFTGTGGDTVSGQFIGQFLEQGVGVVDRTDLEFVSDPKSLGVDAVVSGNVTEFNPSSKLLVFKDQGKVVISDRVYPISGTTVLPTANAFGIDDANVFTVSASVAVSAKMIDTATGEVVWAASRSYEGLDVNVAVDIVVGEFIKSLKPFWKDLK
jgi:curli biogenesis system outer membrane secretion channel CsgG